MTSLNEKPKFAPAPDAQRRVFLSLGAGVLLAAITRELPAAAPAPAAGGVKIEMFTPAGKSTGVMLVPKITKSDADWRSQLSQLSYQVTRQQGTERAYTGAYASNHDDGLYRCICCDTALFDSTTKFESGTGWPSFFEPASADSVELLVDDSYGMRRVEVRCAACGSHLGHVFEDGPRPTGLRYCINSCSLDLDRSEA
jgi:peptide-methionine (R)-S-oxide reductase